MPKSVIRVLALLRFLTIAIIGILLLGLILKQSATEARKPIVLFALDNSSSLLYGHDTTELKAIYEDIKGMGEELSEGDYEVKTILFGDEFRPQDTIDFGDKSTDIGEVFDMAYDMYGAENLAAIVLATDGIFNEGRDPIYAAERLKVPVYSVMLGDTTTRKDLRIKKVFHNKIAYLGDKFTVQVDINAHNLAGQSTTLRISAYEGGRYNLIQSKNIDINKRDYFFTEEVVLEAKKSGVNRFLFSLSPLEGEVATANNSREIFVEVLDNRQKILILSHSPHPDIAAITHILNARQNYDIRSELIRDFKENIAEFDLVILHQLPSTKHNLATLMRQLDDMNKPVWFIIGRQTDLNRLNQLQSAVTIRSTVAKPNEVSAKISPSFSLFNLEEETKSSVSSFVPLAAPFGNYTVGAGTNVLLYQKIGQVDTEYPLLLFQNSEKGKRAVLTAEGLYKWRLYDFLLHDNDHIVSDIVQKTATYLNVKDDKRRFKAYTSKNIFDENEPLMFSAELYNESYELVNEPDAHITITNEEGREFPFVFNRRQNAYFLSPGLFPVGQYRFRAYTELNGKQLEHRGQFSIQPVQREMYDLTARHGMLERLSESYGGIAVNPGQAQEVKAAITDNKRIKPVLYETTYTSTGIDLKWLFFALILLLGLEWFLRKYHGSY